MSQRFWSYAGVAVLLLFFGCGPKIQIPPKIDLTKYHKVGVIGFSCNAEGNMDEYATRRLLITLHSYQKKARIVDLGSAEEVLQSGFFDQISPQAIQTVGENSDVDAVFTCRLQITEIKPLLKVYRKGGRPVSGKTQIQGKRASAQVKVWMTVSLWETDTGGTIWRTSAPGEEMVDQVTVVSDKKVIFDANDQHEAFWDLIGPMVKKICDDFKIKHRRIEKK
jgi:hypothetical protein